MFRYKGASEGTATHQVLETSPKFNYQNILEELMYVYITCRPDIGYAITTLSKFSSKPSTFHYITNFCVVWPSIFEVQSLGVFDSINLPLSTLTSSKMQSLILNFRILMMRCQSMSIVLFFKSFLMMPLEMTLLEEYPLLVLYSFIVVVLSFIDRRLRP